MKLIKQNDSAGGLIFKQNQNGKAMKQNYNFGRYSKISTRAIYLRVPTLIGQDATGWSFSMRSIGVDSAIADRHPRFNIENEGRTSYVLLREQFRITDPSFRSSDWIQDFTSEPVFGNGRGFISFHQDQSVQFIIDELRLQGATSTTGHGTSSLNDFYIYNRTLTLSEIHYLFNNRLGNEALSTFGMVCYINFNNPIISGINIMHEDISGNGNHAIYVGLPAGTPEEQLQYVEDNLISIW